VDGTQWKKFDLQYPKFGAESRNIRFDLSTNGMNPFGEKKVPYIVQYMAGHPSDVQHSDMVMSQKKVPYIVYSYPRSEASWHRY
jgi:hypothetical protein